MSAANLPPEQQEHLDNLLNDYGGGAGEVKEFATGVSYAKFAALSKRMESSVEYLAERFRGTLDARDESLPHYFARVLACDPSAEVVIPYRSVIQKFLTAVADLAQDGRLSLCRCGCGSWPGTKKQLAWDECQLPIERTRKLAANLSAPKSGLLGE